MCEIWGLTGGKNLQVCPRSCSHVLHFVLRDLHYDCHSEEVQIQSLLSHKGNTSDDFLPFFLPNSCENRFLHLHSSIFHFLLVAILDMSFPLLCQNLKSDYILFKKSCLSLTFILHFPNYWWDLVRPVGSFIVLDQSKELYTCKIMKGEQSDVDQWSCMCHTTLILMSL